MLHFVNATWIIISEWFDGYFESSENIPTEVITTPEILKGVEF